MQVVAQAKDNSLDDLLYDDEQDKIMSKNGEPPIEFPRQQACQSAFLLSCARHCCTGDSDSSLLLVADHIESVLRYPFVLSFDVFFSRVCT